MADPIHLNEGDYNKPFPASADEFPVVLDNENYVDAWLFNTIFSSLAETEQYLIDHKAQIEALLGDDIIGNEGSLTINIPPANYPAYKNAMAWDSNLLAENIKEGESIFGVSGSLAITGGGLTVSLPSLDAAASWVFPVIPGHSLNTPQITVAVPTVSTA